MLRAVSVVPVIVATARGDDDGVVRTLDAGADDYVTKPFSTSQLDARIRAVLRRSAATAAEPEVLSIDGLSIDFAARSVTLDGNAIELSRKEFDHLRHLCRRNEGRAVTKRELLAEVSAAALRAAPPTTIDVHLSWLRKKLGDAADDPRFLHTVRGVGVRLTDPTATTTE